MGHHLPSYQYQVPRSYVLEGAENSETCSPAGTGMKMQFPRRRLHHGGTPSQGQKKIPQITCVKTFAELSGELSVGWVRLSWTTNCSTAFSPGTFHPNVPTPNKGVWEECLTLNLPGLAGPKGCQHKMIVGAPRRWADSSHFLVQFASKPFLRGSALE